MNRLSITLILFFLLWEPAGAQIIQDSPVVSQQRDTLEVEDNPYARKGGKSRVSKEDSLTNVRLMERLKGKKTGMDYVLDHRYLVYGDSIKSHWYDNLFIQAGAGVEQMAPPASNYRFNPLTTAHLGVGLQLSRLSTVRLMMHGALGYQQDYDRMFARLGAKVDYLFDITSYVSGYQPTRLASVSTVIGFGGQYARLNNYQPRRDGNAWEAHGGLQVRFYTGPHGYLNLEPYIGVATDNFDLSRSQNWHRYDVFYGANVNYVYYFTNHLSRQARLREISRADRREQNFVTPDSSMLQSWQTPWFVEMAMGASVVKTADLSLMETLGPSATVSVGKWFSPVIGLRASGIMRTATWRKEPAGNQATLMNTQYVSGALEAMFNPFGLTKDYVWESRLGAYLLAGGEYGWLIKNQSGRPLHCRSEAYTAGVHLWFRLTDGLRVFLEPRFSYNVYKIPYTNVKWNHKFSENAYGVNIGLTATHIMPRFRKHTDTEGTLPAGDEFKTFTVGVAGGLNIVPKLSSLDVSQSFPLNVNASAIYRFDRVSGVRLALDYMLLPSTNRTSFIDYNMQVPDMGYAPVTRQGLWNHTYYLGMANLAYNMNLTNAFAGYMPNRLFSMEAYLGCGIATVFGEGGTLDASEMLREGHEARLSEKAESKVYFSVAGGVSLSARLSSKISLTLTPQVAYVPNMSLPALRQSRLRVVQTVSLGAQYHF